MILMSDTWPLKNTPDIDGTRGQYAINQEAQKELP